MDRLIRTTTEHFLAMLDDQREFYSPQDLLDAGLPEFLVKRMRLELVRNLKDSVTPPQTDWADMTTDAVRKAWSRFLGAIHEEIRLPASYVAPVIESSLADILDLLVTPRAFLPEYIFGSESKLDQQMIAERCEWVVVYTYFANALPRFMEKKGRRALTKEQADRIIERLDERVTSHYTSLNWAQLFEPWFQLLGEKVEPGLFANFFRDKGKPGVARLFDAEPDPIHRNRLIEILSKPQLDEIDDDFEDVGEDLLGAPEEVIDLAGGDASHSEKAQTEKLQSDKSQSENPQGEKSQSDKAKSETQPDDTAQEESVDKTESKSGTKAGSDSKTGENTDVAPDDGSDTGSDEKSKGKPDKESEEKPVAKPDAKSDAKPVEESDAKPVEESDAKPVTSTSEKAAETTSGESEEDPKKNKASKSEKEEKITSEEKDAKEEAGEIKEEPDEDDEGNLIARYQKTNGNDKHDPPLVSTLKTESEEDEEDTIPLYSKIKPDPEEGDEDVPIWQQFTKSDEDDSGERDDEDSETDKKPADEESVSAEELEKIRSYAKDMEEEFISELFGGDEGAFLEAIEHITRLSDWKEAGSYISKEVFDRNLIDIYSDTAIYFTDRMQTYFLERE